MAKRSYKPVNWDGNKYRLPLISKGRNITTEEKIKVATLVCKIYASDRHTLADSLNFCGIKSDSTWYEWAGEIGEIGDLYLEAQAKKDIVYKTRLKERARTMAEKLIEVYTFQVQEIEQIPVNEGSPGDGPPVMTITKLRQRTVIIKPSVRLIETILFNVDGRNFTRNPDPNKGNNEQLPTDINIEIISDVPPVTNEADIITDI